VDLENEKYSKDTHMVMVFYFHKKLMSSFEFTNFITNNIHKKIILIVF